MFRSFRVGSSTSCSRKLEDINSSITKPEFLSEARILEVGLIDLVDQSMNGRLKSPAMYSSGTPVIPLMKSCITHKQSSNMSNGASGGRYTPTSKKLEFAL